MFVDLEDSLVNHHSDGGECKGEIYIKALSHALFGSPFHFLFSEISAAPHDDGTCIDIVMKESGRSHKFIVPGIVANKQSTVDIGRHSSPDVDSIIKSTPSLDFLSSSFVGKALTSRASSLYDAILSCRSIVHQDVSEWYFRDFLQIPFILDASTDEGEECFYIDTPIGPASILAYKDDELYSDGCIKGVADLHFVATSMPLRGSGMASQLYSRLAEECTSRGLVLRRGEPSIDTCREGYKRRGKWLATNFPGLLTVNYGDRDLIDSMMSEIPHLLMVMTPSLMEKALMMTQYYIEDTGDYGIGISRALAAMSCMSSEDIENWDAP